ncbi:MAG TPA: hypothetical protein VLL25_17465, partial [Acidimicrobiales bacterium]|nr:hypothetical protein [Acidimicrobiales bacterium]
VTEVVQEMRPVARAPRWRRTITALLVILSCVLAPLSAVAIWARNQVLNTDRYVRTVAPLARNPAIQNAIANDVTNALFNSVDVGKAVTDALPSQAHSLAGPIDTAARQFTLSTSLRLLQSNQFQQLWNEVNRRAHTQVVKALTGQGKVVAGPNGKVSLDLSQYVLQLRTKLADSGFGVFGQVPIGQVAVHFQLVDASSIQNASKAIHLLDQLRIVLPILVFVFLGLALVVSPNRRRTLVRWGLGFAGALTVLLAGLVIVRWLYLNSVPSSSFPRDAAAAAFDIIIHYLRLGLRVLAALGLVVAAAAYLAGPGRLPVRVRAFVGAAFRGGAGRVSAARAEGGALSKATAFVSRSRVGFRIAGVAIAVLVLLLWESPTAATLLGIAIALAVYLVLVELFARAAPTPSTVP